MWLTFWLNNFHFVIEFLGAVVCFMLSWLGFDAYLIRKDFKTLSRALGFLFFAYWLLVNSLNLTNDLIIFSAVASYLLGLLLILLNLYGEKPSKRPEFKAVLILPSAAGIMLWFHIPAAFLLFLIAILAWRRCQKENLKILRSFAFAFSFLTLSSFFAVFNARTSGQGLTWFSEEILKVLGFLFLTHWGWQYLKLRLKEEMLLIFIAMALFVATIVSFSFSAILLKTMEEANKANLISNAKVLDYTISRMKNEALSNAQIFSQDKEIREKLENKNLAGLEERCQLLVSEKSMDFLTLTDGAGEVLLRTHSAAARGDNVKEEKAGAKALSGNPYVTIEPTLSEKFSIRGAAPIYGSANNLIGAVLTGFIIDNAFADQIKKTTGLEATVYNGDAVQATSIFDPIGRTRNVGARQTDRNVLEEVLEKGQGVCARTTIFSRPYLAAYLPLKNSEGEIIGMLGASRAQIELVEAAFTANRLTLLVTIIIVAMTLMPAYFLAKKFIAEA